MVCLTGFMGSGKSTIGRLLAAQLAWRFIDLDAEIERESGISISQIFLQKGEAAFRELEHECLTRVLRATSARDSQLVLALGGGTFAQPRNAALIRELNARQRSSSAVVVWLDCATEDLLQRCVLMGDRPLFRDEASFRKLYEERLPYYRQADYRVESGGEPMRVVEQILALGIFNRSAQPRVDGTLPGAPAA
ncbi:MAG TPA: shikimate kinase [Candidatus Acidoferrales bacterium]|jgi:shikimate kinase|nr:shikimate kinase [Candidatus Acidoferrales bacterium]